MRTSTLASLSLIAVGAAASLKTLRRRADWEDANNRACIVLDYDDAVSMATRAGLTFPELLDKARDHGATHLSLPELTLDRLLREGRLAVVPGSGGGRVHLASAEPALLIHLVGEFAARLPGTSPEVSGSVLSLQGHLPTLAEMGLGFEAAAAVEVFQAGLGVVPRPVSFSWPEDHLVERTLAQAAGIGAEIIAFEGDLILGHEMHLDTTVACLEKYDLTFAYFSQTRHQKGDWFIAKRRAPQGKVVLSHYFTPQAMVPEDFHSAAHHWGMLARSRSIRLCYVHAFRRIHATAPLECLHYMEHIKEELEGLGLRVSREGVTEAGNAAPEVLSAPNRQDMALIGLASAGAISLAVSETLGLPEPVALGLAGVSAAGAMALPFLDRPRGHLEEFYPPSYAPKLLALAGAAAAPAAAALLGDDPWTVLAGGAGVQAGTAAVLAALTTGQDYQQHIEEYRSLNADVFLPVAAAIFRTVESPRARIAALAGLGAAWFVTNKMNPDLLGRLDLDLPAGHTHHLSAAQRMIGDTILALGPRPSRKWSGLGLAAGVAAVVSQSAERNGNSRPALPLLTALAAALGNAVMLAAFRRPERPLKETVPLVARSWAVGAAAGTALAMALGALRRRGA